MRNSRIVVCSCSLALALIGAGCRTENDVIVDYRVNIQNGNYASAIQEPEERSTEGGGSELLWDLLTARAADLARDDEKALAFYDAADKIMTYNRSTSIFSQATEEAYAMMLNDKYFPYDGGGQDMIFTCLYKGILYAQKGEESSARTEFNRSGDYQQSWLEDRGKDIAAANERLDKESKAYTEAKSEGHSSTKSEGQSKVAVSNAMKDGTLRSLIKEEFFGYDIFTSGVLDKLKPEDYENPYALHVVGVWRWLNGDGGLNGLKEAARIRPENKFAKKDYVDCSKKRKPKNQVWVYVEDGICPIRESWRIDLPLILIPYLGKYVKYAGLSLPRLLEGPQAYSDWHANGTLLQELANVDALVKIEYDVYMRGAIRREITRTIVDVGIQVALGVVAENVSDWKTKTALIASQYAVAAYSAIRRGADTRSWISLPKRVYYARIARPEDGILRLSAGGGMEKSEIPVPEGNSIVFIRKPTVAAPISYRILSR